MEGIAPIGAGLQEPFLSCWPLVMGRSGSVAHQLMKLFVDVSEATSPASVLFVFRPFCEKFVAITEDKRVNDVWALLELVKPEPDEAVGVEVSDAVIGEGVTVALAEVVPLVAPVAAMRAFRSVCVVQVILVPGELTNGNAAQLMVDRSLACREKH